MNPARRDRLVLILLLLGQFAMVSAQAERRQDALAERILMRALVPFASWVNELVGALSDIPGYLRTRSALAEENKQLRDALEQARSLEAQVTVLQSEQERLRKVLDYRQSTAATVRVADVVFADYQSWLRTLIIRGAAGVRLEVGQPVVAPTGLVGRVVGVAGPWAKVQLITDRAAAAGVQLARNRRQGVLRGSGSGALSLEYLARQADVEIGDLVQTAGIDGVYPRGLVVGVVSAVGPSGDLFHNVEVAPLVDLTTLDQVLVLDRVELPSTLVDGQTTERTP